MTNESSPRAWLLQRVTAVGLVVFLGIHLWLLHYRSPGEIVKFGDVAVRLRTLSFIVVDLGLLSFGLYHAFNGVNGILQDYGIGRGRRTKWVLILLGGVMTLLGGTSILGFVL